MTAKPPKKLLGKLLQQGTRRGRLWLAWVSLCAGTTLLLLSVLIWWNFQMLLEGRSQDDQPGATFLTVSKQVTSGNMGRPDLTVFSLAEINALKHAPQVRDVGQLTANQFPAHITLHSRVGFSSEIFLESVPGRFIDQKPLEWNWQPGSPEVPVILSNEFLNLYNYGFALSQGLPQLSQASIRSLAFDLVLGPPGNQGTYTASVVGFSDRISSVLVPEAFMAYANGKYGKRTSGFPSRLILNVADPSDPAFVAYLKSRDYVTNTEQLRWNRLRTVVEVVIAATGLLALILMGISALVFVLFMELTVARARPALQLLLQLGYQPAFLRTFMARRFVPMMLGAVAAAILLAGGAQWLVSGRLQDLQLKLPVFPGLPFWITAALSVLLLLVQVRTSVRRAMRTF